VIQSKQKLLLVRQFEDFPSGYKALMSINGISHHPFQHFSLPESAAPEKWQATAEASLVFHFRSNPALFDVAADGEPIKLLSYGIEVQLEDCEVSWREFGDSHGTEWEFSVTVVRLIEYIAVYEKWAAANGWHHVRQW
jgi:hypothetical protein